jgi:DNA gyrase/topoisomerase IV subunit A
VSGAAKKRIETLQTGIARNELMIRVIQHRSEILKILERGKSRDDIKARTAKLLRCTAEEADYVLGTSSLYRLASLEVSALKQRISDAQKLVRENQSIVKSPDARLLLDAERTTKSLAETMQVVEDIRRGELKTKKKKRHARTARS